ncbi:MAG: tRNA pseudouridine(38-40) synthase TruA [Deltaproteobacteria bacterium]|nr:tRNA pseudouridine(38-40) synthase TruA [Deltaproteobacteria bacterium]
MRNIKIIVEYDGTCYHGWQRQPNGSTIQQVLEEKIGTVTQEKVTLISSGRTDAGVHAVNQVANFRTETTINTENLLRGINSLLPADIVVKELSDVDETFHARYDAKSKSYFYQIYTSSIRTALYRNYTWHVYYLLDVSAMRKALLLLEGTHDFSSFCGADDDAADHIRTVMKADIEQRKDHLIIISLDADGFLRYMVRNVVGTLVDVGRGKTTVVDFSDIMVAQDRTKAGMTAPPQGLFLKEVRY